MMEVGLLLMLALLHYAQAKPPPSDLGMVLIPAGTFTMGSAETENNRPKQDAHGKPYLWGENLDGEMVISETQHKVTLTRSFYMMEAEVTQGLYTEVIGRNPSKFSQCGEDCPVEKVTWYDAAEFANRLSDRDGLERCYIIKGRSLDWPKGLDCEGYRLPTEAEWEYAAWGRGEAPFRTENLDDGAWYKGNSNGKTHAVCSKQKNGFGLCDMSGNVWEWVWDWYGYYPEDHVQDPMGPAGGSYRVLRGGSWRDGADFDWVTLRLGYDPSHRPHYALRGFRLSRSAP
jgi:formylglycine-generating enzyme required for sulfatase activity